MGKCGKASAGRSGAEEEDVREGGRDVAGRVKRWRGAGHERGMGKVRVTWRREKIRWGQYFQSGGREKEGPQKGGQEKRRGTDLDQSPKGYRKRQDNRT